MKFFLLFLVYIPFNLQWLPLARTEILLHCLQNALASPCSVSVTSSLVTPFLLSLWTQATQASFCFLECENPSCQRIFVMPLLFSGTVLSFLLSHSFSTFMYNPVVPPLTPRWGHILSTIYGAHCNDCFVLSLFGRCCSPLLLCKFYGRRKHWVCSALVRGWPVVGKQRFAFIRV